MNYYYLLVYPLKLKGPFDDGYEMEAMIAEETTHQVITRFRVQNNELELISDQKFDPRTGEYS